MPDINHDLTLLDIWLLWEIKDERRNLVRAYSDYGYAWNVKRQWEREESEAQDGYTYELTRIGVSHRKDDNVPQTISALFSTLSSD